MFLKCDISRKKYRLLFLGRQSKFYFSLLELMVVIAVISILQQLSFPAHSSAKRYSYAAACLSNIKQLSQVYLMYSNDYDDFLPCLDNFGGKGGRSVYGDSLNAKNWLDSLVRMYLSEERKASESKIQVLLCPEEKNTEDISTNYGLNYLVANQGKALQTSSFHNPSSTAMLVENYGHLCYYCGSVNYAGVHQTGAAYADNRAAFFRHNQKASAAFLDGHVALLSKKSLPCAESFPGKNVSSLRNTIFNSGYTDAQSETVEYSR